jgi:biotin operon repressor
MTLSDTQSLVLSKASRHPERLAAAPRGLPAAARNAVFRSMLKNGLLAECAAPREHAGLAWRQDADGTGVALRITDAGLRAAGVAPDEGVAPDTATAADTAPTAAPDARPARQDAPATEAAPGAASVARERATPAENLTLLGQALAPPMPPRGANLRQTAKAVLDAWDDEANRAHDLVGALHAPMERLRAALAKPARAARDPGAPRKPREGTKREAVLALLRRPEGASGPQLAEATGWAPHTVRGFLSGLQKKGMEVTVLERVRQVGPNKEGAKGSYSIYRIAEVG